MLYCSTVWSNTSTQNINKLQSIQNFESKIVTNSWKFDHVTPLLRQLNWLPVKQLLYYRDSVLTYKCFKKIKGLAPKHLARVARSVKYHGNLYILIPLNQRLDANKASSNRPLVGKLTKRSSIHARNTRKRYLLHLPLYRTASGQRTFAYRGTGTSIWNNLDTKAMRFLAVFQASYKRATFRASLFIGVFFLRILIFLYLLLTLNVRSRGKQLVLLSRESRCFPRRSPEKHRDSRENKTNWFPEGPDLKCFVIFLDFHFNSNKR